VKASCFIRNGTRILDSELIQQVDLFLGLNGGLVITIDDWSIALVLSRALMP
jgi:hypothetical protein